MGLRFFALRKRNKYIYGVCERDSDYITWIKETGVKGDINNSIMSRIITCTLDTTSRYSDQGRRDTGDIH